MRQRTLELETRGLELRRINEELTRLSYHDPLTDLANRRMLLERLHGEWELAQARGTSLAFLLFDLDQFKDYNDRRGHLAGDDCLRDVGRCIDAELPDGDAMAGRYGGEEFGVVLPGLTLDHAAGRGDDQRGRGGNRAAPRLQRRVTDRRGGCGDVPGQGLGQEPRGSRTDGLR